MLSPREDSEPAPERHGCNIIKILQVDIQFALDYRVYASMMPTGKCNIAQCYRKHPLIARKTKGLAQG